MAVGDFNGNYEKVKEFIDEAERYSVDLICFPELTLTGYPPEDLLLRRDFIDDNLAVLNEVVAFTRGRNIVVAIGYVDVGDGLYNALAVIYDGEIKGVYHKVSLPNYGVFDEKRYFSQGKRLNIFAIRGTKVGFSICEDIWDPYGPVPRQVLAGVDLLVNVSASPYHISKIRLREEMLRVRARDFRVPVVYVNLIGGQDELVFDGSSVVFDPKGRTLTRAKSFEEVLLVVDVEPNIIYKGSSQIGAATGKVQEVSIEGLSIGEKPPITPVICEPLPFLEEVYQALLLGTKDYVRKNGFNKVVIGLSGGIDSSLVATIAADALGPEKVVGVFMPSRYTSEESSQAVKQLAGNLGIELYIIPIEPVFKSYLELLGVYLSKASSGVAEENLQARIRGNILMALSNSFGWLVLTTGNKSELACGYATLYGDMAGGFAVIKDLPKTLVYELARWRNKKAGRDLIPQIVLTRPPSAELRPGQKDTDDLPPYEVLDPIMELYVEEGLSIEEIVKEGFDKGCVENVVQRLKNSEYKRRQAPPGIKVTPRAFGKDWRMPITNRWRPFVTKM